MNIPQQINFTGKLEEDVGATMFFIPEKQQQQKKKKKKKKKKKRKRKRNIIKYIYGMKQTILNLWQENGTLSMIVQRQIMV